MFLIIPIILVIIGFSIIDNEQQKEIIPKEKIIQSEFIKQNETQPIKTDEEILLEIENRYSEIEMVNTVSDYQILPREWQTSGPFSIDRKEYALGEKIFLMVENLRVNEKGQISVLRPLNQTHYSVWTTYSFDGEVAPAFNIYFEPKLFNYKQICDKNDLIGEWVMVFQNTNYENLRFKIIDQIVTGDENKFNTSVC